MHAPGCGTQESYLGSSPACFEFTLVLILVFIRVPVGSLCIPIKTSCVYLRKLVHACVNIDGNTTHACIHAAMEGRLDEEVRMCMYACMYVSMYVCKYVCMEDVCVCTFVCIYIMYIYVYICIYVYMYICICIYIYIIIYI